MRLLVFLVLLLAVFECAYAASDLREFDFGAFHRCSLDADGAVDCLGESNRYGQIGNGGKDGDESRTPRPERAIARGARKLATGAFYTCAIVGDALQCWGDLPPRKGGTRKPVVLIEHGVSDIATGDDRVCAIVNAAVQCIGTGGQTGSNEYQNAHPVPDTVIEHGASAVAVGLRYACAVVEGALWCWGEVPSYAWNAPDHFLHPQPLTRVIEHGVTAVAAGAKHACAIVDGALRCWGDNSHGQVGAGILEIPAPAATPAPSTATVVEGEQRCERYRDLSIACRVEHPVEVIADGVESVVAKGDESCAIVRGALYCWGQNASGQLGIASHGADVTKPTLAIAHGVSYAVTGPRTCARVDGMQQCSRPCTVVHEKLQCPSDAGFDTHDLAFGLSPLEARLGVWRGTIGTHDVMACLQRAESEATYYYVEHGLSIALRPEQNADGAIWNERTNEGTRAATWTLDKVEGDTLTGNWADATGQRTLMIRLKRIAAPGDPGSACSSITTTPAARIFNAPRVDAQAIKTEPWNEHARKLSVLDGTVSAIELLDVPGAKLFNAAVREWLRDEIVGYYDCLYRAPQGDSSGELDIEWRADPWIVIRELYENNCGGPHPNGGIAGYWVWNLAEGKRIDPWDWIVTIGKDDDCAYIGCERQPTDELNDLIVAAATRNKAGDECSDSVNEYRKYGFYQLRPSAGGLVFSTDFERVVQACDEDIEISWGKLEPFLSARGHAAMRAIQRADAKVKPDESVHNPTPGH